MVKPLERWQWMRQPGVQSFGASQEIFKLNEELYERFYVPFLEFHHLEVESWKQFRRYCRPHGCYISVVEMHRYTKDEPNIRVSDLEDVRPYPHLQFYALKVDSFDSPDARQWGMLDDDEVYGYKIGGSPEAYEAWDRKVLKRGFRFESELCGRVVPFEDGFAIAMFDPESEEHLGFLGRQCSVEDDPPWIYVSRRIARHILNGCLTDRCPSS